VAVAVSTPLHISYMAVAASTPFPLARKEVYRCSVQ
jgi:hypothetical protein